LGNAAAASYFPVVMPAVYRGCRREGNKRAFSLGGTTLQGQYFGLSIPEVYKAVCIGCKSFES